MSMTFFFFKHNFCIKPCVPREPRRDPSNRRLYEHGIWYTLCPEKREPLPILLGVPFFLDTVYIRHCQDSNSQPVPSQVCAYSTRPQLFIIPRLSTQIKVKKAPSMHTYFCLLLSHKLIYNISQLSKTYRTIELNWIELILHCSIVPPLEHIV